MKASLVQDSAFFVLISDVSRVQYVAVRWNMNRPSKSRKLNESFTARLLKNPKPGGWTDHFWISGRIVGKPDRWERQHFEADFEEV
jgi:hypothetical protein